MADLTRGLLDCGVSVAKLHGQSVLGDRHVIQSFEGGMLVAVIDGLGHGEEAALAATEAARTIEALARESVIKILRACHEALRHTRGVVMSVASFNVADQTMVWMGVGNVEGLLLRAREQRVVDAMVDQRHVRLVGPGFRHQRVAAVLEPRHQADEAAVAVGLERGRNVFPFDRDGGRRADATDLDQGVAAGDQLRHRRQHLNADRRSGAVRSQRGADQCQ